LREPRGFCEKVNWRIVYDQRPVWEWTCDKVRSKEYAATRSPGILIPEVMWFGTDLVELESREISGRWVLKSNRTSKHVVLGEGRPSVEQLRRETADWTDFQRRELGESAYRFATPGFLLERWIETEGDDAPPDYKVLVFDGVAQAIQVHRSRFTGHRASLFDRDWNRIPSRQTHVLPDEHDVPRPRHLEELIRRAEEIGSGFDSIRVDLYDTAEGVWFGETSPYSWSGFRPFSPPEVELWLGSFWTLPDLRSRRSRRRPVG
jgi:hypothetical protein